MVDKSIAYKYVSCFSKFGDPIAYPKKSYLIPQIPVPSSSFEAKLKHIFGRTVFSKLQNRAVRLEGYKITNKYKKEVFLVTCSKLVDISFELDEIKHEYRGKIGGLLFYELYDEIGDVKEIIGHINNHRTNNIEELIKHFFSGSSFSYPMEPEIVNAIMKLNRVEENNTYAEGELAIYRDKNMIKINEYRSDYRFIKYEIAADINVIKSYILNSKEGRNIENINQYKSAITFDCVRTCRLKELFPNFVEKVLGFGRNTEINNSHTILGFKKSQVKFRLRYDRRHEDYCIPIEIYADTEVKLSFESTEDIIFYEGKIDDSNFLISSVINALSKVPDGKYPINYDWSD